MSSRGHVAETHHRSVYQDVGNCSICLQRYNEWVREENEAYRLRQERLESARKSEIVRQQLLKEKHKADDAARRAAQPPLRRALSRILQEGFDVAAIFTVVMIIVL